jgi:cyclophilin family peptidyl-prolyl cis-trans isomerase
MAPTSKLDPMKTYDIQIQTNCGTFTIRLDPKESPHAASSFLALTKDGYYNHTIFYKIIPDLMIQGGDPTATGTGGPGYSTFDHPAPISMYKRGVVAMEKPPTQPPGTAGSQFFIVTAAKAHLPPVFAIVGNVIDGLNVIDRIASLAGANDLPAQVQNTSGVLTQIVEIQHATIVTP